jgi:hypothetical protein
MLDTTAKTCNSCGADKDLSQFHGRTDRDGDRTRFRCKQCESACRKEHYRARTCGILDKRRVYRVSHKDNVRAARRKHYDKNYKRIIAREKARYANDPSLRATRGAA